MNLMQITNYESGVIMYTPDGAMKEGFVCNWSAVNGLPRIFATGVIGLGEDLDDMVETDLSEDEIDLALALAREEDEQPTIDRAWRNEQAVIITFEGWN